MPLIHQTGVKTIKGTRAGVIPVAVVFNFLLFVVSPFVLIVVVFLSCVHP